MKGRGRGQLPPFDKAAAFLLRDSVSASPTIASVTYDDPNGSGSWEDWEPGGAWGNNGSGGGQVSGTRAQKDESELRWDEDGDTNLRHPKQLPRTLITTSELDWEDSEECATELWLHPQRRVGREAHALPGRGRPQAAPDPHRGGRVGTRANTGLRPTAAGRAEARAPQTGPRPTAGHAQRSAEPTARIRHGVPQRLPAPPPPRAAEPLPERRERTITQPGAAAGQPPQQLPAAPRRSLQELPVGFDGPPQQLPAAPRRSLQELPAGFDAAPQRSLYETRASGFDAPRQPPQQLPAAPRRSLQELPVGFEAPPQQPAAAHRRGLHETHVSGIEAPAPAPQPLAAPRRGLHETHVSGIEAPAQPPQPPAAPRRGLHETHVSGIEAPVQPPQQPAAAHRRGLHETHVSGIEAPVQPPQPPAAPRTQAPGQPSQQLPAAPRRGLHETQVSGFGAAPTRDTPAPGSLPRHALPPAPAIESLRGRVEAAQRVLPPPRPQNTGHIPTILGTPAASQGAGGQAGRLPPPAAVLPPGAASTSVQAAAIEHLQEQLLEAMARSRVQEARAAEAEKSALEVEEQLEAIVRSHMTESEQLQEQLRLTSEQLRLSEVRAIEAERRSLVLERPSNMLHLDEPVLAPRSNKQGRANLVLSGLLASSLSFGGAAYFMFYAPLQKQVALLEQQRVQDAQAQANAITNLKAQTNAERQGLEAQAAELRKQLEAARAEAAAAAPEEGRRGSRSRRGSADADSEEVPAGTRSARAIERRMRRSRGAAAEEQDAPAPARPGRSSRDNGDDPLGGI